MSGTENHWLYVLPSHGEERDPLWNQSHQSPDCVTPRAFTTGYPYTEDEDALSMYERLFGVSF